MSRTSRLEDIKESPKESSKHAHQLDLNAVEMVFGSPYSKNTDLNPDVHTIANEKRHNREQNNKHNHERDTDIVHPSQPLLEPDRDRQMPPLAGPEVDDLDDVKPMDATPYPGIDDGLLGPDGMKPDSNDEGGLNKDGEGGSHHSSHDEGGITDEGKWTWHTPGGDEPDFPYDGNNGLEPRFGIDDRPGSPFPPGSIPDVNTYQQKKNLAQGMMDLALLSANANQLRYVLESSINHPYYYPSLAFISFSIILQVAVGVGLIMNSRYNVKDEKDICKADKINNMTVLGIFLITIINVFITSFSVASPTTVTVGPVIQQAG